MTFDPAAEAEEIAEELRGEGDPARAAQERHYLKSDLHHFGASVPAIRKVVKAFAKDHPDLDRSEVVALTEALWAEPVHERRMAAVALLDHYGDQLLPTDLPLLERLIRESRGWALVDGLAASVVGPLVERSPGLADELDRWATDPDLWVRRSALLALLPPLRRGEGDFDRFARYADGMLEEREVFIRKAIGWVLRETGKRRPDLVYRWILLRASRASGVTVREAVKPLSEEQRERVLAAHRVG
jgi:3-methyladenine DNA glycosylase AlkD